MKIIVQSFWVRVIVLLLSFLIGLGGNPANALALPGSFRINVQVTTTPIVAWSWWPWQKPKGNGGNLPGSVPGGTRGDCNTISQKFVGIVPLPLGAQTGEAQSEEGQSGEVRTLEKFVGLTADVTPKLWFYTPALPEVVNYGELMLQVRQENGKEVDALNRPLSIMNIPTNRPGIFAVDFDDFDDLELLLSSGEAYRWYFSLICEPTRPSRNPSVNGWIKYEPYDDQSGLGSLNSEERVERFIDASLWNDALTLAAALRCQPDANDVNKNNWIQLLKSAGFDDEVAQADVLSCPYISEVL